MEKKIAKFESGAWQICYKVRKKNISRNVILDEVKGQTLIWEINLVSTQQTMEAQKRSTSFPKITELRKTPKIRNILPDRLNLKIKTLLRVLKI